MKNERQQKEPSLSQLKDWFRTLSKPEQERALFRYRAMAQVNAIRHMALAGIIEDTDDYVEKGHAAGFDFFMQGFVMIPDEIDYEGIRKSISDVVAKATK